MQLAPAPPARTAFPAGSAARGAAAAQEHLPGEPAAGRAFAEEVCGAATKSPAGDPAITELVLRAFFQTPHVDMPDLMLTPEQMDDVIAYIIS